jgi:hypothetical protein
MERWKTDAGRPEKLNNAIMERWNLFTRCSMLNARYLMLMLMLMLGVRNSKLVLIIIGIVFVFCYLFFVFCYLLFGI